MQGNAYNHLNLSDIQDAILQVEEVVAASGLVAADRASAAAVLPVRAASESSDDQDASSLHRSSSAASDPFRVVVTDVTGTLKPKSVFAIVRLILQARLKVTNSIVNDEWSIDGPQLMRALTEAAQPPAMIGGLDDQLRNLPMEPTRLNIELVRIRMSQSPYSLPLHLLPLPSSIFPPSISYCRNHACMAAFRLPFLAPL